MELVTKITRQFSGVTLGQGRNIVLSLLFKGGGVLINFYIFRIGLLLLGNSNMGIWLTISSIASWISFFDLGIANGIKNKIGENIDNPDSKEVRSLLSSGYLIILVISIFLALVFCFCSLILPWGKILNTQSISHSSLVVIAALALVSFALRLFSDVILTVLISFHKSYAAALITFIGNLVTLLLLLLPQYKVSLITFIAIVVLSPLVCNLLATVYFFSTKYRGFSPSLRFFSREHVNSFFKLGASFFIIQLMYLLIFTTDNLIVAQFFLPSEVTVYNTAYKYFSIVPFVFAIVLTPFWPAITNANAGNDIKKVKAIMNMLMRYWFFAILMIVVMCFAASYVYKVWTNDTVRVPLRLTIGMGVYVIVSIWSSIYGTYLNAVSKIRLQVYSSIIVGLLNIPLCYIMVKYLNMGSVGVIIATITCLFAGSVWAPIQYQKLISQKAKGIWNK